MASKTFTAQLQTTRQEVNDALQEFLADYDVSKFSRHGHEAWDYMRDFTERPGKRIRGSLVLTAFDMYGGSNRDEALKAAIAIELIQNYLLIVDDVMDRSEIRRGKPTIQYMYYDRIEAAGDDFRHVSDMLAINVGLIASHVAGQLMSEIELDAHDVLRANKHFHDNIKATTFGQVDDLFSGVENTSEEDILLTHELKSSYYTFINPMQVGAILAGASDAEVEKVRDFGVPAGIAFQLQDDILGLFGNDDVTGKSYLDDLKEGKFTLIIQQALARADKDQALVISHALGNHHVTDKQAKEVREIVESCGARRYAEDTARRYADDARKVVEKSDWPQVSKDFLQELMNYIVERLS